MVKIYPFQGILYNKDRLKNFPRVFTPPYDVISAEEQDSFYEVHDFNFIRLILGKEFPGDSEYNNKYVRAAAFMDGWLRHKILQRDEKPAFYIYEQKFSYKGKKFIRLGFIGLLRLEDMGRGKVFPHEETHSKPKLDRLKLMRYTSSNLESIFCLYSDTKNKVTKILKKFTQKKPVLDVADKDKFTHRIWRIDRKSTIAKLAREMRDKTIFIADGHHRYEASQRFKNELKMNNTKFSEEEAYNHIMVYFNALEDKGLLVLPIHRTLRNLAYFNPGKFENDLKQYFEIKEYKATKKTSSRVRNKLMKDLEKAGLEKHAFGMYPGNYRYYLLTLKNDNIIDEMVEEEKPKAWKRLDTTILHYTVFESILSIANETEDKLIYVKDVEDAIKLVDEGKCQVAFLLNATRVEEITSIASKFVKMPQKSTFFYPKLLSGLVINKIEHGEKIRL